MLKHALGLLSGLVASMMLAMPAGAVTVYPEKCCPNYCDALEDEDLMFSEGDQMYLKTRRYGVVKIPTSLEQRISPDGKYHVCIGATDFAEPVVKCMFVPAIG